MLKQTFTTLFAFSLAFLLVAPASPTADASNQVQKGEMAGYLLVPNEKAPVAWNSFATPMAADPNTFGYRWDPKFVKQIDSKHGPLVKPPQYYRLVKSGATPQWVPVRAEEVPAETGLTKARFERPTGRRPKAYATPEEAASCWKKPGPTAGPSQAHPGDGRVVTYYWYRFADQPSLLNADMTDPERDALQARVEKLHRSWKKDRDYLAPPAFGILAELDPALIVTPPPGLKHDYGFAKPGPDSLLPLEALLARPVSELKGDEKNIAVLARAFHGVSANATRMPDGRFVEQQK